MTSIPASATRETGYNTGMPLLGGILGGGRNLEYGADDREHVPQLLWPNSVPVYSQMRVDGKVTEVLRASTLPILRARRWLDPNGAPEHVVRHVAADLNVPILGQKSDATVGRRTRGRFDLNEHLRLALTMSLVYGHMPFEQVYNIDTTAGTPVARLRKLAPRMPETIAEIVTQRDGGLVGIRQNPSGLLGAGMGLGSDPLIPVSQLVMYSHEREGAAWQGRSLLRSAYRAWRMKDEGWRNWATSMRRNGMGQPVYIGAPGETEAQLAKGAALAAASRSGETAGAGVPNGADLRFKGVEGSVQDHEAFLRYCDEEIAGSVLAEFLKLGSSSSGSRALGDTFLDFFVLAQQQLAEWLLGTFNAHVVEDIVDLNWGEEMPAPRLVMEDVGSDHRLTVDAIQGLVTCGALQADEGLDTWIRDTYRLPARTEPVPAPAAPAVDPQVAASRTISAAAATPRSRDLNGHEIAAAIDVEAIDTAWTTRLEVLLQGWIAIRAAQVDDLVTQVEALATTGDLSAIAGLAVTSANGRVQLEQAMRDMVAAAVTEALAEASRQGVTITTPDTAALTAGIPARAQAVDDLLASGLANAAKRAALTNVGAGIDATEAAAAVRAQLEGLTDTYLREQLGGALTAAQNEGRLQVMATGPVASYYASELLDAATCPACAAMDEHQFASLAEARKAYPTGGFKDCAGGSRCRGTTVAVYAEESTATNQTGQEAA